MRFPIFNFQFPIGTRGYRRGAADNQCLKIGNWQLAIGNERAFTMIEIALCLAIIGFALVSILLVLPLGMNTQRDTRQETIISQDATLLLEAIRNGARGFDDLTNNIYAITNYITEYDAQGQVVGALHIAGYTYTTASYDGTTRNDWAITNGLRIIGLLSTPEYTENFKPIPTLVRGGFSNHVVAYVRSFSGLAAEKPPQDNQIMREDAFAYRVLCVNAPLPADTNLFLQFPVWNNAATYSQGQQVLYLGDWRYWQSRVDGNTDTPGPQSANWAYVPCYPLEIIGNQREFRVTFLWPQLPNGNVGAFRQTFRASVGGQLILTNDPPVTGMPLYFYQPQSFTSKP